MPGAEKVEFEFPDEAEEKSQKGSKFVAVEEETKVEEPKDDDGVEVEIEEKPKAKAKDDEIDEEVSTHHNKVQRRIEKLTRGYKEANEKAERALREKEEAVRIAQAIVEENKRLKGSLSENQTALLEQAKRVVTNEVEAAKRKYREAYEAGDAEGLANAQEELTAAKIKMERVNNFKPQPLQEKENEVQTEQPVAQRPVVDRKAEAWAKANPWFGEDDEMTSFAYGVHAKLVKSGVDPNTDEYYEKLNSRIKKVFADRFESADDDDDDFEDEPPKPAAKPKSNVVAPATRSSAPKKVKLTPYQVSMAKRLNIPLELYAQKVAEQQRNQS